MTSHLLALSCDANDPHLTRALLGRPPGPGDGRRPPRRRRAAADDDTGFRIRFLPTEQPTGPNQLHLHLTSTSLDDQQSTVDRALALGGRHIDVGQLPEEEHVVLADPEGNAFCVIEPGNNFLAGCRVPRRAGL